MDNNKILMYLHDIQEISEIAQEYQNIYTDEKELTNKLYFCSEIIFKTAILLRAEIIKNIEPGKDDQINKLLRELTRD